MMWITKKSKITYLYVLVPMFLITTFYSIVKQNSSIWILSLIFFFVFSYSIRKLAYNEMALVNKKLTDDLEPMEYVRFFEYATNNKRTDDMSFQMKSALVTGYLAIGDFAKAEPLFYELRGYLNIPASADKHINPLSACINFLVYTGQFNAVCPLLMQLYECNKSLSDKIKHKDEAYNVLRIKYLCASNQLDNIEDFNNVYENAPSLYAKLQLKYFLGCYYETNNQHSEAAEQFEYVSANGKDLNIAKMAKEKLI